MLAGFLSVLSKKVTAFTISRDLTCYTFFTHILDALLVISFVSE
jgi:hypothetical protein